MHHCPTQNMLDLEFQILVYTTVSVVILLCHCQSQLSHHGCKEGHFWFVQWEEVGTVLHQGYGTRVSTKEVLL